MRYWGITLELDRHRLALHQREDIRAGLRQRRYAHRSTAAYHRTRSLHHLHWFASGDCVVVSLFPGFRCATLSMITLHINEMASAAI